MQKIYYRPLVQEPVGTVDSLELINRAGVVGQVTGANGAQVAGADNSTSQEDEQNEEEDNKKGRDNIPKEV